MSPKTVVGALCAMCSLVPTLTAQGVAFADRVVAFDTNNQAGGGVFQPSNALGAPSSTSTMVHSLGVGGFLTLGFSVVLTDGPGDDLIVFENPFASAGRVYSEAMFVEVSTDGVEFARFPNLYTGPAISGGSFALNYPGIYSGLAGIKPHRGGVAGNDPGDVVEAGGDSFDLADLRTHPSVLNGKVDLANINQVRLVDVVAGQSRDSVGTVIEDPTAGSADVNAIAVIHHRGNVLGTGPEVELTVPASGNVVLTLRDPDGLADLDPNSLRMSLDGVLFPPEVLLNVMTIRSLTNNEVTLELGGSLPPSLKFHLSVSVKDRSGARSGQNRVR